MSTVSLVSACAVTDKADYYKSGQGTVLTWMISIVRYRALDMLRHKKIRQTHSDEEFNPMMNDGDSLSSATGELPPNKIHSCMDELNIQQRQAIHLAYFNGFTHSEVVSHLGSPLGTVSVYWIFERLFT
jgi:RNA polymerase sigma-70 factor (ECF subfamily)